GRSNGLRCPSHNPVIDQFIAGGFRNCWTIRQMWLSRVPRCNPGGSLRARSLTFVTLPAFAPSTSVVLSLRSYRSSSRRPSERDAPVDRHSCPADGKPGGTGLPPLLVVIRAESGLIRRGSDFGRRLEPPCCIGRE